MLDAVRFSVDAFRALPDDARRLRLAELESVLNARLSGCEELGEFQTRLYAIIEGLKVLGHVLYAWDYDCDVEYWGGDYVDKSAPKELFFKSNYPQGIQLGWGDYFPHEDW